MEASKRRRVLHAQRALLDLEHLVISVLEEHPEGLQPNEIAKKPGLEIPNPYGNSPHSLGWGVLDSLHNKGLVQKRDGKAVLA